MLEGTKTRGILIKEGTCPALCRKRQSMVLGQRDMGQLLQLFPVSRRAAADHRGRGGNYDDAVFHRLQPLPDHPDSGGLHIHLL